MTASALGKNHEKSNVSPLSLWILCKLSWSHLRVHTNQEAKGSGAVLVGAGGSGYNMAGNDKDLAALVIRAKTVWLLSQPPAG